MSKESSYGLPVATPTPAPAVHDGRAASDVRLFHTADGGEIEILGGLVTMSDGLETAVYLSLFGGNERDSGLASDDRKQWWGNLGQTVEARTYRSQTQHLLRALPATTANLRRLEDAIDRDLAWLKEDVAHSVAAVVSMPRLNSLQIDITVVLNDGAEHRFQFAESWGTPGG